MFGKFITDNITNSDTFLLVCFFSLVSSNKLLFIFIYALFFIRIPDDIRIIRSLVTSEFDLTSNIESW